MSKERLQIRCESEVKKEFIQLSEKHDFKTHEACLVDMMKVYKDTAYSSEATILNEHLIKGIESTVKMSEIRLGNRFSKLLSEMIVNESVILKILADNKMLTRDELNKIRLEAMQKLQSKNNILNYNEIIE